VKNVNNNNNNNNNTFITTTNTIILLLIIIINKGDTSNNRGDWDYSKSFRKYVSNIPGKREVKELQKTAILGTAHILWKVLL
jgi:hypothetical protein